MKKGPEEEKESLEGRYTKWKMIKSNIWQIRLYDDVTGCWMSSKVYLGSKELEELYSAIMK